MGRKIAAALALAFLLASTPVLADARSDAKAQVDFGIEVARHGLWREAIYRWQRAVAFDPTYPSAWNNLGVGLEQEGRFDEAREAYERALDLDPGNLAIEQNYDLFLEVSARVNQDPQ